MKRRKNGSKAKITAWFLCVCCSIKLLACREIESLQPSAVFEGHWLGTYAKPGQSVERKQVALTVLVGGLFTLRDLDSMETARGQFYFDETSQRAYFYVQNNPTNALSLRERTTMVTDYKFLDPNHLNVSTNERFYTLNRSSIQLGSYGIDGHWYCSFQDELWRLFVDANDFRLSQNLSNGLTYFHEGHIYYGYEGGVYNTDNLSDIRFKDITSTPFRFGFTLAQGEVLQSTRYGYELVLRGEDDSKEQTTCFRANDLVY